MKKSIFLIILCILTVIISTSTFTACGENKTDNNGDDKKTENNENEKSDDEKSDDEKSDDEKSDDEKSDDEKSSKGLAYAYAVDGFGIMITGIGTCTDTDLVIPSEIDGYTVTGIDGWAFEGSKLTGVKISDGVTYIGEEAFMECEKLTNITIGNGVTSIGAGAFCYCTGLTSITIPDRVTSN